MFLSLKWENGSFSWPCIKIYGVKLGQFQGTKKAFYNVTVNSSLLLMFLWSESLIKMHISCSPEWQITQWLYQMLQENQQVHKTFAGDDK